MPGYSHLLSCKATLVFLALARFANCQGDYTCQTTADCAAWASPNAPGGPYPVSRNMTCVADPLDPQYGYCGYAGAPCGTVNDCDYGTCSDGVCRGYLGTRCSSNATCMGYFMCSGGFCGGPGAIVTNGPSDCMSGKVSSSNKCTTPNEIGQSEGQGCSYNANCAPGLFCRNYVCRPSKVNIVSTISSSPPVSSFSSEPPSSTSLTPSQQARLRFRRNTEQDKAARAMNQAFANGKAESACPFGQTACSVGVSTGASFLGFECIDTMSNLESCGGCLHSRATGQKQGVDCTALQGVDDVACINGSCKVYSCQVGWDLDVDGQKCN